MSLRMIFLKIIFVVSIQTVQSDVENYLGELFSGYLMFIHTIFSILIIFQFLIPFSLFSSDFNREISNSTTFLNQTSVLDHRNSSDHQHAISFRKSPSKFKFEVYLNLSMYVKDKLMFLCFQKYIWKLFA